jgi:hypothetical protein
MSELNESGIANCIPFDQIVKTRWNTTLTVINNQKNNGDYTFTEFTWFRNGAELDNKDQSLYVGRGKTLDPNDVYRVELRAKGVEGKLYSCDSDIKLDNSPPPPPAKISGELLRDGAFEIYDIKGRRVINPTGNRVLIQKNKNGTGGRLP